MAGIPQQTKTDGVANPKRVFKRLRLNTLRSKEAKMIELPEAAVLARQVNEAANGKKIKK